MSYLFQVKKVRDKSQQLRDSNKEFAVNNIELEPKFTEMKSALLEKATQLSQIKEEYDKKLLELSKYGPRVRKVQGSLHRAKESGSMGHMYGPKVIHRVHGS